MRFVGLIALFVLSGCTINRQIDFHPVNKPEQPLIGSAACVSFDEGIRDEIYSFRAFGSGVANKWNIGYGARVYDTALAFLSAAYSSVDELPSGVNECANGPLIQISNVGYRVENQAAHVDMQVSAIAKDGSEVLRNQYSERGWSGQGAVTWGGGAFAQKGATRSSTDQALNTIFRILMLDLQDPETVHTKSDLEAKE